MQHSDNAVAHSCANLFSLLAFQSKHSTSYNFDLKPFSDITLPIIMHALSCLDHSDVEIQACGTSILTCFMDNGRLLILYLFFL
jgi:hypothetical protein